MKHKITSDRTLDYDKQIGGLTRQIPHRARLLTEETLPGSLELVSEVEGFVFQVPEAWANKSSGSNTRRSESMRSLTNYWTRITNIR